MGESAGTPTPGRMELDPLSPITVPQDGEDQPFTPYGSSESRLWSQSISPSSLSPVLQAKTFSLKGLEPGAKVLGKGVAKVTSLDILATDKGTSEKEDSPEGDLISALPTDEAPWLSRNTSFVRLGNEMVDILVQKEGTSFLVSTSQDQAVNPSKLSLTSSCSSNSLALDSDATDEAWIRPLSPLTLPENSSWG